VVRIASAYDCDDVPYRLLVFVQIAGALIMAAGITTMFEGRAPNSAVLVGYVVMRLALVTQWLRAAKSDPIHRRTAHRYAIGVSLLQVAWVLAIFVPQYLRAAFVPLATGEILVPVWAERFGRTTNHVASAPHR
jgi:low temperature requirement protein LtrA